MVFQIPPDIFLHIRLLFEKVLFTIPIQLDKVKKYEESFNFILQYFIVGQDIFEMIGGREKIHYLVNKIFVKVNQVFNYNEVFKISEKDTLEIIEDTVV